MTDSALTSLYKREAGPVPGTGSAILPALWVMDVQSIYCHPGGIRGNQSTHETAGRIAGAVPAFRRAGMRIYAIYAGESRRTPATQAGFYRFQPGPGDILVPKDHASVIAGSGIEQHFKRHDEHGFYVCGGNIGDCIYESVVNALEQGYDVTLLTDLMFNDNNNRTDPEADIALMCRAGARRTTAREALAQIMKNRTAAPSPSPR